MSENTTQIYEYYIKLTKKANYSADEGLPEGIVDRLDCDTYKLFNFFHIINHYCLLAGT